MPSASQTTHWQFRVNVRQNVVRNDATSGFCGINVELEFPLGIFSVQCVSGTEPYFVECFVAAVECRKPQTIRARETEQSAGRYSIHPCCTLGRINYDCDATLISRST